MPNIDFKDVDRHSPICFNGNCPSCGECLRYKAGQQSPETLRYHLCVVPQAIKGDRCELYQSAEPVRVAYGFSRSYDDVMKRDFTPMRKELTAYLGNKRGYYKYLRGEWPLIPEQQRHIEAVFRRYGYEGKVVYDRMEDVFELEAVPY
ncbi:MAG: hypothetical protein IJ841_10765 [Prevotella sp.]|nr:hypothetical protein [Prevotella sp.]